MKLRTIVAGTALAALVAAPIATAQDQTPPVDGTTGVGGTAPSFLELILNQPAKGFASFSKTRSYQMSFNATVITTDSPSLLTVTIPAAATAPAPM